MKKILLPVIIALISIAVFSVPALAQPMAAPAAAPLPAGTASPRDPSKYWPDGELDKTKIKGDSAILIDARTGKVLFEKDADAKRYPASTTKIMTCLLALESGKDLNAIVTIGTIPPADLASDSDNMALKKDEMIKFEDLLSAMMVKSANDAADAIAMYVAGTIEDFVALMNQRAQELGMTGTHYTCTNGLPNDTDHYTTARDMVKLSQTAIKYPEFVKLVSSPSCTISPTNKTSKKRSYSNTNKLLGQDVYGYMFANGIKTGFTSMAMHCLISSAKQNGMLLIAAELHTPNPRTNLWVDSVTMFEYGFQNFDTMDLQEFFADQAVSIDVEDAASTDPGNGKLTLNLKPRSQAYITDRKDVIEQLKSDPSQFQREQTITKGAAPILQDENVGTVTYYYEGDPVLTCDLLASRAVDVMATPAPSVSAAATGNSADGTHTAGDPSAPGGTVSPQPAEGGIGSAVIWLMVAALLIALAIVTIRFVNIQRRGRRYSQYNYRQGNNTRMRR